MRPADEARWARLYTALDRQIPSSNATAMSEAIKNFNELSQIVQRTNTSKVSKNQRSVDRCVHLDRHRDRCREEALAVLQRMLDLLPLLGSQQLVGVIDDMTEVGLVARRLPSGALPMFLRLYRADPTNCGVSLMSTHHPRSGTQHRTPQVADHGHYPTAPRPAGPFLQAASRGAGRAAASCAGRHESVSGLDALPHTCCGDLCYLWGRSEGGRVPQHNTCAGVGAVSVFAISDTDCHLIQVA